MPVARDPVRAERAQRPFQALDVLAFLPLGGELRGVLLGAGVATIVGAIDDFRGLNWWQKLGGQTLAAAIPTTFGVWVQQFTFPIVGIHALPAWFGVPLTVIGIVTLMNMVNFLDGLDGLAAGVWTSNISSAHKLAALLRAGSVYVNAWAIYDPSAPFGGFKASGIGREHGHDGLDAYLETKTVWTAL